MVDKIRQIRQECLDRLSSLVKSLRETSKPEIKQTSDLRRRIRKLKKYSEDVERTNVKYIIEDIDEETRASAKKEANQAMKAADEILFSADPVMDIFMASLDDDDSKDSEDYWELWDTDDDTEGILAGLENVEDELGENTDTKISSLSKQNLDDNQLETEAKTEPKFTTEKGSYEYPPNKSDERVQKKFLTKFDDADTQIRKHVIENEMEFHHPEDKEGENVVDGSKCQLCDEAVSKMNLKSLMHSILVATLMHRKHVRLKGCCKCEVQDNCDNDRKIHIGDISVYVTVSCPPVFDVSSPRVSDKLTSRLTSHKTDESFNPKTKAGRLVIALLVCLSVSGDWRPLLSGMGDCLCSGWSGLYPWDPGGTMQLQSSFSTDGQITNLRYSIIVIYVFLFYFGLSYPHP